MAQLHDLHPISCAIIWAKRTETQLKAHLERVEDVLGRAWEIYN